MENEVQPNTLPAQPLSQVPVPSATNWKKIILFILLGLVVITVSVFIGIQIGRNQITNQQPISAQSTITPTQTIVNPTTNPTADWKTYKASQTLTKIGIDFSIEYPKEWFISEKNSGTGTPWVIMAENKVLDVLSRTSPCLSVAGGMYPDTVGINGVIEQQDSHQLILSPSAEKIRFITPGASENFTLENITGVRRKVKRYNEDIETMQVFIKGNANNTYGPGNTNYFIVESCPGTDENIFNQILSTFKFSD